MYFLLINCGAERKVACEIPPFSFRNKLYLHMKAIEGRSAFPKRNPSI